MAEVPEVEILVRDMQRDLPERTIVGAEVWLDAVVRFIEPAAYRELVSGRRILRVDRRAKYILCTLDADTLLTFHCMLDGMLRLSPADTERPADTLLTFALDDSRALHFIDRLGYARTAVGPTTHVRTQLRLDALGPEVLDPSFTPAQLAERITKRRSPLKAVLVKQENLAGLGQRDADESAWLAQILPTRLPATLSDDEFIRLHGAIIDVLDEGIRLRGTMRDLEGVRGQARHRRNVYGRMGQPCPRCGTLVSQTRIGGQATYFCTGCQH